MEIDKITDLIIGAGILVHRTLGPGLLESIYEECLTFELQYRGLIVERQKEIPIIYRGHRLNAHYRLDMIVENKIVVEVKSVIKLDPVFDAQMLTYLKLTGFTVGLIMNFNVPLLKDGLKRIVLGYQGPLGASAPRR